MANSFYLGDIQIGMVEKKGALEVEVIRARGLVGKPGSKALPGNSSSDSFNTKESFTFISYSTIKINI